MKKDKKRFVKMVTVLCAAIFVFGSTTAVFGATDIIGRGTGGSSISNKSASSSSSSSSKTSSQTYNGQGSTAGTASAAQTAGTQANLATASYSNVKGKISDPATVTKVGNGVQTGVAEKLMPILAVILTAVAAFWIFFHFQMNQVRYGKSEKYYKELLDFKVSCRI